MIPVAIAGAALAEAAVAALTPVAMAVSAAVAVAVGNALSEKVKEVEKARIDASAAVPGAKTPCPYDEKIKKIDKEYAKAEKEYGKISKEYSEVSKEIDELKIRDKELENMIEEEARAIDEQNQVSMEKPVREHWRASERERIEQKIKELSSKKYEYKKQANDLQEMGKKLRNQKANEQNLKLKNQAKIQEQLNKKRQASENKIEKNIHEFERDLNGKITGIKPIY